MNFADWKSSAGATLRQQGAAHLFIDGSSPKKPIDQTVYATSPEYRNRLRLTVEARPVSSDSAALAIMHGSSELLFLRPDGSMTTPVRLEAATLCHDEDFFQISATWNNLSPAIYLGLARPYRTRMTVKYKGAARPQWEIRSVAVEKLPPFRDLPFTNEQRIVFVDVGALGGLDPKWAVLGQRVRPVMFEPQADEAARIEAAIRSTYADAMVIPHAIADRDGVGTLYVTHAPSCSSMRRPDLGIVRRYPIGEKFEIVRTLQVETSRYDTLHRAGLAPAPDVLKLDVQGFEYEVLEGFGALLESVVAIETEAHFARVYQGQKLLSDISAMLDERGFALKVIRPNYPLGWDRELIEVNAVFIRRSGLDRIPYGAEKLRIAADVLDGWGQ